MTNFETKSKYTLSSTFKFTEEIIFIIFFCDQKIVKQVNVKIKAEHLPLRLKKQIISK